MKSGLALAVVMVALALASRQAPAVARQQPSTFGDAVKGDETLRRALGLQIGVYLNRRLGRDLPAGDEALHDATAARALWNNTKGYGKDWRNRDTGASGTIEPLSRVEPRGVALCRRFHDAVRLPGRPLFGVDGTACLSDGGWTVDF